MGAKVDFSGVSTSFEVLEEGLYPGKLADFKYVAVSKSSGKPYYQLEFDITEPEGRKAWRNYSLQPQSLFAIKRALIILGADEDDLEGEIDLDEVLPQLIGADCTLALVIDNEYDPDEPRNKVAKILPAGAGVLPY